MSDPGLCMTCGHHRGAHFRNGCDADLAGGCPCQAFISEQTDTGDALNLARSRFANAKLAYDLAAGAHREACEMRTIAFDAFTAAADDLAAVSRRALQERLVTR